MNLKGAIFDLDGTLLDSMHIWRTLGSEYLKSRSINPEEGLDEKFRSMSMLQAAEYYQTNYGLKESAEELIEGIKRMLDYKYTHTIPLKPGVAALLKRFRSRGIKMCVATATDRSMVEPALKRTGIDMYFSGIFTCGEVGSGKDLPMIFENALEHLGTDKKETLVFEDAHYAIKTAKEAGFIVAAVYDKTANLYQDKILELCDYYINSLEDWSGEV